jgi:ketosteroid isomerase-like protein
VLQDIEAIRTLRMQYHYIINEGLFDRAAEIYTDDAYVEWASAGTGRGHKEIVDLFWTLPTQADFVKHFVSNHIVNVDGDEATGLAYVDARYASGSESSMIAGRYDERYRRTPDGWRISETILVVYFKATLQEGWGDMVETMTQQGKAVRGAQ